MNRMREGYGGGQAQQATLNAPQRIEDDITAALDDAISAKDAVNIVVLRYLRQCGLPFGLLGTVRHELEFIPDSRVAEDSDIYHLIRYAKVGIIQLVVSDARDDLCTIEANPTTTVWEVKAKIEGVLAFAPGRQQLVNKGLVMDDDQQLFTYKISPINRFVNLVRLPNKLILAGSGKKARSKAVFEDSARAEIPDPSAGAWPAMPPMSTRRMGLASVGMNNELYAIGGYDGQDYLASSEVFNPVEGNWAPAPSMATKRQGLAAAVFAGKLYAFGGSDGCGVVRSAEVFDPKVGKWTMLPPLMSSRICPAAAADEQKIFAIGGMDRGSVLASVEAFNPKKNAWEPMPSMRQRRMGLAAVTLGDMIYALGGIDGTNVLASVEAFNPKFGEWEPKPSMGKGRNCLSASVLEHYVLTDPDQPPHPGRIFAMGGLDGAKAIVDAEVFDPWEGKLGMWNRLPPMSTRRQGLAAAAVGGKLYALGGHDGANFLASADVYDPITGDWQPCRKWPQKGTGEVLEQGKWMQARVQPRPPTPEPEVHEEPEPNEMAF